MNVFVLALVVAHTAVSGTSAADYRLREDPKARVFADPRSDDGAARRSWTPGVDGWTRARSHCSELFERDLGNGNIFRFGSRCEDDELPYAHPVDQMLR